VIAVPPGYESEVERVAANAATDGELTIAVVAGGATRARSVGAGLDSVETAFVAVHDAARPLITAELVEALLRSLAGHPSAAGVIAASPITDTVKRVRDGGEIARTENREGLWAAETPQVFHTEILRRAHSAANVDAATDDAMLVELTGGAVVLEPSPGLNLKVTTPADLRLVELLLS
jgi:2-C-methyl-D-erythritol 4-phosphate cytidylyltransferase